jgi:hypothetical protein
MLVTAFVDGSTMATRRSPTARHRRLMVDLKRLREGQGLTREQAAERAVMLGTLLSKALSAEEP